VGGQGGSIDLQQMASAGGLVQLRSFQGGKSHEVQLASIPAGISSSDLQRALGVKLEDIQAQALLGGRTIKLEELGVSVQNAVSAASVTQGLNTGRIQHQGATMVLTPAQIQQFTQAVAVSGANSSFERTTIPITIAPATSAPSVNVSTVQGSQQSSGSGATNQAGAEFSGLSTLMY